MTFGRNMLLTPDLPGGGGGPAGATGPTGNVGDVGSPGTPAPSTTPEQTGAAAPSSAPPAPTGQPAGTLVSDDQLAQYQRAEQQVNASNDLWSKVRGLGYEQPDTVLQELAEFRRLRSDPTARGILDVFSQPAPAQNGAAQRGQQPASSDVPTTREGMVELFNELSQAEQQKHLAAQHEQGRVSEAGLLDHIVQSDPTLAPAFKDAEGKPIGFNDAFSGKGQGKVPMALSSLLDTALYLRAPKYQDGTPMPVTDPGMIREAAQDVAAMVRELKAFAIMEASQQPGTAGETTGSPVNADQVPGQQNTPGGLTNEQQDEQFRQEALRLQRAMQQQPMSQLGV